MRNDLIDQLVHTVFRFKQIGMTFPVSRGEPGKRGDVTMAEVAVMKGIKDNIFEDGKTTISDYLCITRAAVSQMVGAMEKKGYLTRDINKTNRRKIALSLTERGRSLVAELEQKAMELLADIIDRLGEEESKQLIKLSNHFADIIEEIKAAMDT
jgi:DNA-binding MarR family transcriptional regulator